MSLDSLMIRGLCVGVLLAALAFTQIDLRKRGDASGPSPTHSEVVASQSFEPEGSASSR